MTLSLPWLGSLFFVFIRLSTGLLFTPIQAIRQLPVHARLLFIFTLSLLLTPYVKHPTALSNNTLLLGGLAECANGLILATSIYV
ncbi:MAG: hypothetical protein QM652_02380 [Legionella sp.]|uniref:hypothetical protein n=1 Tax=Legionella sp. TaxID=459 RepID=UPI0039E6E1DA